MTEVCVPPTGLIKYTLLFASVAETSVMAVLVRILASLGSSIFTNSPAFGAVRLSATSDATKSASVTAFKSVLSIFFTVAPAVLFKITLNSAPE
ncbi:hypothetical protein D9M68_942560 [compost metagenome]